MENLESGFTCSPISGLSLGDLQSLPGLFPYL